MGGNIVSNTNTASLNDQSKLYNFNTISFPASNDAKMETNEEYETVPRSTENRWSAGPQLLTGENVAILM